MALRRMRRQFGGNVRQGAGAGDRPGLLHGLVSNSEWTGVPLSVLLDEAGIDPAAKWLVAEGADAQHARPQRSGEEGL